ARGGCISRKITNANDRKTLKTILSSLDVPEGMAVILRTAGIGRTKAEIKRDFEYLIRLWNTIRDMTLQSTAPTLVHEEGDIVRRSIRDHYSRDIEEVQVEGDDAYKAAKEFMKLLIPSHARKVKQYKDTDAPLLRSYGVEGQLDAIHNPIVHLPSGGYIVINPTEALVSIDVNSGRATKERSIEETALKTNLEAATEVARQLRLRDLAGLIVIDFIDMEVNRNNSQVERRMKEALKHDRARIQVGRISPFGLLEMSRQRLRPSLIETSSEPCPYCGGGGGACARRLPARRRKSAEGQQDGQQEGQQDDAQGDAQGESDGGEQPAAAETTAETNGADDAQGEDKPKRRRSRRRKKPEAEAGAEAQGEEAKAQSEDTAEEKAEDEPQEK
ncbi:MAG: Rne/Rng family ribonuclease, partial [Arenibacter algicola]|nr:Rne/Rng family ribonuclease [Arenibacter algicola]